MITWDFNIDSQFKRYNDTKRKLETNFFQDLTFYVLPFMPEKFRARVVFYPEVCDPKGIYSKQMFRVKKLEHAWNKEQNKFLINLKNYFPKLDNINIFIMPSIYGTIGSYDTKYNNKVYIYPRYDRKLIDVQKLLINTLTHYFFFDSKDDMEIVNKTWFEKQEMSKKIQTELFPENKFRNMTEILDRQFAGKLAEKSITYLNKLGYLKIINVEKPENLTKNEGSIFDLLLRNKNKITTFEEISEVIWGESSLEKYSEYAITKSVERLRKKLPRYAIHTQRDVGYLLLSS